MNTTRRTLSAAAVTLVAAVALAACGSGSSSTKTSTNSNSTTTSASTTAAVVKSADNANLGTILVDASGKTVYTLTSGGSAVACTAGCLAAWPPVLLPSGTSTATGGTGVKNLGVTTTASGTQVTSKGLPLYTYAGDSAAGDANGEGITSFGGTWHVVKVGSATSGSTGSTSSTTYSSGY